MSSEKLYGIIIGIPALICWYFLTRFTKHPYLAWIVCANLAGFLVMGIDKKQSIHDDYRVPNKTLMAISFLGGPLGIFAGVISFKHKSLMPRFKLYTGAIFMGHLLLFLLMLKT